VQTSAKSPTAEATQTLGAGLSPTAPPGAAVYGRDVIRDAHFYWGLDAPVATFLGQLYQESKFDARAQSPDADGLAQFTPATALAIARTHPADLPGAAAPMDPAWAIRAMVLYDHDLWLHFAEAEPGDEQLAFMLAAYDGGPGWLDRERGACACASAKYFGNVENECGKTRPARSPAACAENRHYSDVILHKWRPLYERWLEANAIQ